MSHVTAVVFPLNRNRTPNRLFVRSGPDNSSLFSDTLSYSAEVVKDHSDLGWFLWVVTSKVRKVSHPTGLAPSEFSYWHRGSVAFDDLPHELHGANEAF